MCVQVCLLGPGFYTFDCIPLFVCNLSTRFLGGWVLEVILRRVNQIGIDYSYFIPITLVNIFIFRLGHIRPNHSKLFSIVIGPHYH